MPGHSLPLTLPMTPSAALKLHLDTLSDYERGEILEYTEIYCTGHGADKVRATLMASEATPNHGAAHHPLRAALHPLRAALRRSRRASARTNASARTAWATARQATTSLWTKSSSRRSPACCSCPLLFAVVQREVLRRALPGGSVAVVGRCPRKVAGGYHGPWSCAKWPGLSSRERVLGTRARYACTWRSSYSALDESLDSYVRARAATAVARANARASAQFL